jgi:lysophospholipase L1-like esterase
MPHDPLFITVIGDRIPDLDAVSSERIGSGWVSQLRDSLTLALPGRTLQVVDATEGETTAHRLRERWTDDVLLPRPGIVFVVVGLSDCWGVANANNPYAKDPAGVVAVLEDLLERARVRCPDTRVILVDPVLNPVDQSLLRLGPICEQILTYAVALRALGQRRGLAWLPAGTLVRQAKQVRASEEWLGTEAVGVDTCGAMLIAQDAARLVTGAGPAGGTRLRHGQTVLLIGDSITDAGRRSPNHRPMGCGYARLFQGLQAAREPATQVQLINKGIGGDTILDIESRWERDVTPYHPDWLLLYTGINDMNTIYGNRPVQVVPEVYGAALERCLNRARALNPELGIVLVSPFFLSRDDHPASYRYEMVCRLPGYRAVVERVAQAFQARHVDLQAVMEGAMARWGHRRLGSMLGADIVHPGALGSLVVAEAVYAGFQA